MGRILGTKMIGDKVIFEVEMDYDDSLLLKGNVKNIHLFSEDAADVGTHLSQRGTNEATKYFLIPRTLRDGLDFDGEVKCQKIETGNKKIFIFALDKKK